MKIKTLVSACLISIILLAGCSEEEVSNQKETEEPKQEETVSDTNKEVEAAATEEKDESKDAEVKEEEPSAEEDTKEEEEAPVEKYDLGITPDELEANFNSTSSEIGADLNVSVEFEEGKVGDSVKASIGNSIAFIGSVDKETNMVRDLVLVGSNFKDTNDSMDYMMTAALLMAVADPSLSADERGDIFLNQLSFDETVSSLTDTSTVVNEREYTLGASQEMGVMFGISNSNN